MWAGEECEEEETFVCETACSQEYSQTLRTFWKEIREQTASSADIFATLVVGICPRVVSRSGENFTPHLEIWNKHGFGVTWALRDQNGTSVRASLLPFCFLSAGFKETAFAALPAGAAQQHPKN